MPSVYDLKPRFQNLLRPLCRTLAAAGVTANQVTVAAAALSVAAGVACVLLDHPARWLLLPAVLLVRMGLNAIDGMLAREHHQKSRLGAILNEVGDVVSDAALYLPLVTVGRHAVGPLGPDVAAAGGGAAMLADALPWATVGFVVLAMLTEFVGVLGPTLGAARNYAGPMGKSDRAFWIGTLGLLLGLGWVEAATAAGVLVAAAALAAFTAINRARQILVADPSALSSGSSVLLSSDASSSHVLG